MNISNFEELLAPTLERDLCCPDVRDSRQLSWKVRNFKWNDFVSDEETNYICIFSIGNVPLFCTKKDDLV